MPDSINLLAQKRLASTNDIINSLSNEEFERLLPDLEPTKFKLGDIIYRSETQIKHVYFPNHSMISVIATTVAGQSAEIGVIGREGLVGIEAVLGSDLTLNEHLVQHAGDALRIKISCIRKEFARGDKLHDKLLNFTRLMMIQIGQTALCNRLHTVEERLSRWLLLCRDRAGSDELQLTQEFLSIMLGCNRATVTMAAIAIQNTGFISYRRGNIIITNRQGLEDFTCDCYRIVKTEYDRALI